MICVILENGTTIKPNLCNGGGMMV